MGPKTKSGSKLTVGAMNHEGRSIAEKIFALKDPQGPRVRVHIDMNGKYTIETNMRQKLLICELDIPERKCIHTENVVNGETVVESKEKELKLENLIMKEYLKEAKKI